MVSAGASKPRASHGRQGLVIPWATALVLGILTGVFAPVSAQWAWYAAAAGLCLLVAFVVQLSIGRADGFLLRTATASFGSVLILGILSLVAALFTAVGAGLEFFPAA